MKTDFTKGINTNTKPINTPSGFYRDAVNMRVTGNAKRTDEGNEPTTVPTNFIQWGSCAIGDETILIGTTGGKSIIGSLDIDGNWKVEIPNRAGVDILGVTEPVQIVGKKNWAGERIIYFSTPVGSRRINLDINYPTDDEEFDKITSLFLEYDLPRVVYTGENNSGELLSGVYEIAARLVTDSGATTPFGIISGIIPVVDTNINGSRYVITGAPPQTQTSKALKLRIDNVDPAFKYIELGVVTYIGLSNTQKITKTTQILINGQTSITTSYRGASDDFGALTTEEFIVSGIAYTSAKYITQKDGTLLLGSPVEEEQPPINWFRVAQNITARYKVKRIPFTETLKFEGQRYTKNNVTSEKDYKWRETSDENMNPSNEGYKDPITCALYKGYRRDEVYAFTITPVFISGVYGPTVHIVGPPSGTSTTVDYIPNEGGLLGSYISGEKYPDDRYPGLIGTGLRLFKFPDAKQQPIIEGNVETNNCFIRVLGVEFSNIVLDASELQYADQIAGFIIGRVDRRGQETQLAQGIVRPNVTLVSSSSVEQDVRTTMLADGYGAFQWSLEDSYSSRSIDSTPDLTDFTFVAPDLIHNLYPSSVASHIKQYSAYKSNPYAAPMAYSIEDNDLIWDDASDPARFNTAFHNVTGDNITQNASLVTTEVELESNPLDIKAFGVPAMSFSDGGKRNTILVKGSSELQMASSQGFTWFSTTGNPINFYRPVKYFYRNYMRIDNNDFEESCYYNIPGNNNPAASGFRADFVVHTLTRRNDKQYGPLNQMVGMFVDYVSWKDFSGSITVYNGDTFISKYGLKLSDESAYVWPESDDWGNRRLKYTKAPNMNVMLYFWLESDNNYDYRHFTQSSTYTEETVTGDPSTLPFYPKYKQLANVDTPFGLLSMGAPNFNSPGYSKGYNTQYSTQPTIKPYVVTPIEDVIRKGSLVNRIIYSAQAVQGEKADGYQIFMANNYYDVPQEYGELTDLYVNRELYASTAQVQWKLFYNVLATQATSAGEITLGTGGAFNRPAVPMATVDGGYAGNTHWLHAINTIWGRVIVDKLQGKFFLLREDLATISGPLDDNERIRVQLLSDTYGTILVGSEPLRERVFIKVGITMWSYNLERQMFISRHSWTPRWFFSHGPHLYSNQTVPTIGSIGIFKHGVGITGMFYGKRHPSSITIIANGEETVSKLFQNMEILTKKTTESGLNLPFDTWNKLELYNEERYTGVNNITIKTNSFQQAVPMELLASKVKDCFRITVPRDVVINPEVNIFTLSNHAQHNGDTVLTKWLPKMRGTYMELKLTTNNSQGPLFIYDVTFGLIQNIR